MGKSTINGHFQLLCSFTRGYSVDEIRVFFHPTTPPRDGHVEPWSQVLALTAVAFLLLLRGHLVEEKAMNKKGFNQGTLWDHWHMMIYIYYNHRGESDRKKMIATPRCDLTKYMMLRIRAGYCNYRQMGRFFCKIASYWCLAGNEGMIHNHYQ